MAVLLIDLVLQALRALALAATSVIALLVHHSQFLIVEVLENCSPVAVRAQQVLLQEQVCLAHAAVEQVKYCGRIASGKSDLPLPSNDQTLEEETEVDLHL
jgi:hypothetical protein